MHEYILPLKEDVCSVRVEECDTDILCLLCEYPSIFILCQAPVGRYEMRVAFYVLLQDSQTGRLPPMTTQPQPFPLPHNCSFFNSVASIKNYMLLASKISTRKYLAAFSGEICDVILASTSRG